MKVRDKRLKKDVDVCDKDCPRRSCYWPREDPGVFTQGPFGVEVGRRLGI